MSLTNGDLREMATFKDSEANVSSAHDESGIVKVRPLMMNIDFI